ncbi:MAG: hypothetical protein Q9163_003853 [Psora crenata]
MGQQSVVGTIASLPPGEVELMNVRTDGGAGGLECGAKAMGHPETCATEGHTRQDHLSHWGNLFKSFVVHPSPAEDQQGTGEKQDEAKGQGLEEDDDPPWLALGVFAAERNPSGQQDGVFGDPTEQEHLEDGDAMHLAVDLTATFLVCKSFATITKKKEDQERKEERKTSPTHLMERATCRSQQTTTGNLERL